MRKGIFILGFVVFVLSSCRDHKSQKDTSDSTKKYLKVLTNQVTFNYKYTTLDYNDPTCETKKNCSNILVKYPLFIDLSGLNNYIKKQVLTFLETENPGSKKVIQIFNTFAKNFIQDCKDNSVDGTCSSGLALTIKVIRQDSNLVVIEAANEISGGAHPNVNYSFTNWDSKKDKLVSLEDLLTLNYKVELTKVGGKIFRKEKMLPDTGSLSNYTFENDIFSLSSNFKITPNGLDFFYDNYQIAPYAEGPIDLLIPYQSIKHLLRPNTVISQYIK